MQAQESASDILARVRAMETSQISFGPSTSAQGAAVAPTQATMQVRAPTRQQQQQQSGETVADILARAEAMAKTKGTIEASFSKPSATPASTRTVARDSLLQTKAQSYVLSENESVAEILARAAAMAQERKANVQSTSLVPQPVQFSARPRGAKSESVSEILARATAMQNERKPLGPPKSSNSQAHAQLVPVSATVQKSPRQVSSKPVSTDRSELLAAAKAWADADIDGFASDKRKSAAASALASDEPASSVLARVAEMSARAAAATAHKPKAYSTLMDRAMSRSSGFKDSRSRFVSPGESAESILARAAQRAAQTDWVAERYSAV